MEAEPQIHPTAVVDPGVALGPGTRVWHFCHLAGGAQIGAEVVLGQNVYVAASVRVGDRCRIQNNVSLYDGVLLEEEVFVGPSAVFTNVTRPRAAFPRKHRFETTRVRRGATIGANATIRCGITVGEGALVAAGAVVLEDVPDYVAVGGVPARPIQGVCRCGEHLRECSDDRYRCVACERRYRGSLTRGLRPLAP
jgi:UDP-2-acetamido-3-amino-2,3-dideoxy-glucuronate N-acetyltransferase